MRLLFWVFLLMCATPLMMSAAFADDDEFDKLMIQRKKPVYREAAPERSYQDDDSIEAPPPPRPQKAKKTRKAEQQEPAVEESQQRIETGSITKAGDGYSVTLLGCQRIGNKLSCNFSVTNNSKHNAFYIQRNCSAVDNFGNAYTLLDSHSVGDEPNGTYHKVLSGMSANGTFSLTVTPNARSLNKLVFHVISQHGSNLDFEINNIGL